MATPVTRLQRGRASGELTLRSTGMRLQGDCWPLRRALRRTWPRAAEKWQQLRVLRVHRAAAAGLVRQAAGVPTAAAAPPDPRLQIAPSLASCSVLTRTCRLCVWPTGGGSTTATATATSEPRVRDRGSGGQRPWACTIGRPGCSGTAARRGCPGAGRGCVWHACVHMYYSHMRARGVRGDKKNFFADLESSRRADSGAATPAESFAPVDFWAAIAELVALRVVHQ